MRVLWFTRDGVELYRCGRCKQDQPLSVPGTFVKIGNEVIAVLCNTCLPVASREIQAVVPHSFPEMNICGEILR